MKIWLRLHGYEPCSWSFVWTDLHDAFEADGDVVCDFVAEPEDPEQFVELWWGDPQFWKWSGLPVKAKVSIALSEAHSLLRAGRQSAIKNISTSDLLICPSRSAMTAFLESPIDVPMTVVPFGVDPEAFSYVQRDWRGEFRFLHAGVTQYRKGSWMVPEAFISAFHNTDDVELTMASVKPSPMFIRLKSEYGSHPRINFTCELKDSPFELYQRHHCYVSPHLSEGFGLMPLEAMSSGMVCLVARCSAPREYFRAEFGHWIEMSENYGPVADCLPETAGFWRLPDLDSLARCMLQVYTMREQSKKMGQQASRYARENMTWRHTVRGIKSAIKEILDEKNIGDSPSIQRGAIAASGFGEHRTARR